MSDSNGPATTQTGGPRRGGRGWLITGLAGAVIVVGGLMTAFVLSKKEPVMGFVEIEPRPLFPGASRWPDIVGTLELETAEDKLTFHRRESTWRLGERDGYPTRPQAVDQFIRDLATLDAVYVSKGEKPNYAEFGVGSDLEAVGGADLEAPSGTPARVTLREASGDVVVRAVLGTKKSAPGGSQPSKIFVRRDGDSRVWLADRELNVSLAHEDWLRNEIVNVERSRVTEVVSVSPDNDRLSIARTEQGGFRVNGLPEDDSIEGPWVLEAMAAALEQVRFIAVMPETGVEDAGGWDDAGRMVVSTVSGLEYRMRLFSRDEELWVRFHADTAGTDGQSNVEPSETAQQFNARHDGWLYLVPPYVAANLTTRGKDLVERSRQ